MPITYDDTNAASFISRMETDSMAESVSQAHHRIHAEEGPGADSLGWVDWPATYDQKEFARVKRAARRIQKQSQVLIVIGIGGSYLGAKAAIEALSHTFHNQMDDMTEIYFAGHNISSRYLEHLLQVIEGKDISVNVISKSGTTTEPALAFRIFREIMENKYGEEEAKKRIYVTTDAHHGALRKLAEEKGYEAFVIPENIGGRYSVLTPVGLLPIAVAGLNIDAMMDGARAAYYKYDNPDLSTNDCYQYATARTILHNKGKSVELLVTYEPNLDSFSEWWKQLFGESEGKDGKGLFPAAVTFTTDLHAIGQYIQDGRRLFIETVLQIKNISPERIIREDTENIDGLNYLSGKTMNEVNQHAALGATLAHVDGDVPNLLLELDELNEFTFGELVYFFEKACAISGTLLGVNPFDQPGVEAYKKNMFALLGKEGYENEKQLLEQRARTVKTD